LEGFNEWVPTVSKAYGVSCNPISLVEAKWAFLRLGPKRPADRGKLLDSHRLGLRVVLAEERLNQTDLTSESVERVADGLQIDMRSEDYFDMMIYGTACALDGLLPTEVIELLALKTNEGVPQPKKRPHVEGAPERWKRLILRDSGAPGAASRNCKPSLDRTSRRSSSIRRGCSGRSSQGSTA
jgi:hypothetical protein